MIKTKKEIDNIIKFIQDYFNKNNIEGIIIGISGGKDSAVVSALFTKALGKDKVIGVSLPCNSKNKDYEDALILSNKYNFKLIKVDLTNTYNNLIEEIKLLDNYTESEDSLINLKPRLRMSTLYFIAQMYTKINNKKYIVAGCGNKCEQFVGYFTKGGDGVSDINILTDFTVDEVIELGKELEVPKEILYKAPNDGLSNKTDEEKLGFTYKDVEKVINKEKINKEIQNKILTKHNNNIHKFITPTYKKDK